MVLYRIPERTCKYRQRRVDKGGANADEKLCDNVDAHPVAGDEGTVFAAHHLDAHDVHVDRRDLMQHRDDESAAIDHDLFTQEARAHERRFFGGAAVASAGCRRG